MNQHPMTIPVNQHQPMPNGGGNPFESFANWVGKIADRHAARSAVRSRAMAAERHAVFNHQAQLEVLDREHQNRMKESKSALKLIEPGTQFKVTHGATSIQGTARIKPPKVAKPEAPAAPTAPAPAAKPASKTWQQKSNEREQAKIDKQKAAAAAKRAAAKKASPKKK